MGTEDSKKVATSKAKPKKAKVSVAPSSGPTKTIQNVSLQSWPIPTGKGTIVLVPGATVEIPASAVTNRLINLYKRRLVSIH
jgi:hypothetical protein